MRNGSMGFVLGCLFLTVACLGPIDPELGESQGPIRSTSQEVAGRPEPTTCSGDRFPTHRANGTTLISPLECCQIGDRTWHTTLTSSGPFCSTSAR